MRFIVATTFFLIFFPVDLGSAVQRPAQASKNEQDLRRLEDEWLGSYLRGDKVTFDRTLRKAAA